MPQPASDHSPNEPALCGAGRHVTLTAYEYDGAVWCPKHRPPSGPVDPVPGGRCDLIAAQPHNATSGVRWLPYFRRHSCAAHLKRVVDEVNRV